jgi:DNA-directed RNA polymerase subunit RPC12/RpoP
VGFKRCPGSVAFTQPKIELARCPHCGSDAAEVWSDEAEGRCPACGGKVVRTASQSCVDWCKYAEECLGRETYRQYQDTKSAMRKDALLRAAEDRLGWDERRKARSRAARRHAEAILREAPDADPNVVIAAAVLLGGGADGPAAQGVLEALGYPNGFVKRVCEMIARPPAGPAADVNARTVHDAVRLAARPEAPPSAAGR